jgi:hypothetical protein
MSIKKSRSINRDYYLLTNDLNYSLNLNERVVPSE